MIDANTSITIGFMLALVGGGSAIFGLISKRDANKIAEGREHGIIITKLDIMEQGNEKGFARIFDRMDKFELDLKEVDKRVYALETKRTTRKREES